WTRWKRSTRSGGRSWKCAISPACRWRKSPACWTAPSAPSTANGNVAAPSCRPCSRKPEAAMQAETLAHWRAADALFDQWLDLDEAARDGWLRGLQLPPAVDERLRKLIGAHRRPDAAF